MFKNYVIPADRLMQRNDDVSVQRRKTRGAELAIAEDLPRDLPDKYSQFLIPIQLKTIFFNLFLLQNPLILFSRLTAAV